jgi:glycosyltransferase involved in cell wall biosynthesis
MRILHISAGNLYGGVEVLLRTLARCSRLNPELQQEFAVCFEGRLASELKAAGASVHVIGAVRARNPLAVKSARRRLLQILARGGFDLAVCHMAWAQAILGPVVRDARIPLVLWHHDPGDGSGWLDRWARLIPPDLAICNSLYTAAKLRRCYPELPAKVLYCPVEMPPMLSSKRSQTREELGLDEGSVAIIQIGRMERNKGQLEHLEALSQLRDLPDWVCWQVGEAQRPVEVRYLESLRNAAERLGIGERVRFLGYQTDTVRLLHAADIYCQPNIGPEGFGITFIEALSAGVPVVTSVLGPSGEIVDPSCGVLVPPGDAAALAAVLRDLIEAPTRRERLGAAGPARAKALCDPLTQMNRLGAILASVIEPARSQRAIAAAPSAHP